ncbi:PREDICTED: protein SIX6OS1 [Chinchilla lanigera]|uniref:Chromosome 14 open reading frame 39 n=1 Tax=Chinchilla lanigera TaxID=34839 RepID=A0A8C2UTT2_CHILA|nr:PREDICTED: protein SIX6OS1 [Chinchilla lanigera]
MSDSLFARLDRLLLEFVFQYQQDISAKEDTIERINKCLEDIKESKETICKIRESINKTDEEITHYRKHIEEIKEKCSNWKTTCDVFHKHEDYMQGQFTIYQETIEKDREMYHGRISQYKDVLKQYQLKYSEIPLSRNYYEKKSEYEEIENRMSACTEQLKTNEAILKELLVPAPFPSLSKWTLHIVNLRFKTEDILTYANNFTKNSSELKKEINEAEIEINSLNKEIARLYQSKNLSETLEENNKNPEKRKELKERIIEKDEHVFRKTPQGCQLYLPYESQKLVRPRKRQSSDPKITAVLRNLDIKEEISVKQLKLANTDFRQKENYTQVFNDSNMNDDSHVTTIKSAHNFVQLRLTPEEQSNYNQWFEKGRTDAEYEDKGTGRQVRESECTSQGIGTEAFEKSIEDNSDKIEEMAENFPRTPETPLFLRTPEAIKTPESLEKMQLPKTPLFEINRNAVLEGQSQTESSGFSFLMSYSSRSPGLSLFDSSIFDSETSSDQPSEHHHSAVNLNPPSSQEIGNLFGKRREDVFTFSFSSDTSTRTFGAGKDDFVFPFSFEQDQNSVPSSSEGFSSSLQNTTQFSLF